MIRSLPSTRRDERGVAMLIVITVLAVLVMIAVPYVLSMKRGQENTEALAAQERADFEAGLLLAAVRDSLGYTHPAQELARAASGVRGTAARSSVRAGNTPTGAAKLEELSTDADPEVDVEAEYGPTTERFRKQLDEMLRRSWMLDPRIPVPQAGTTTDASKPGPTRDDRGSIWSADAVDAQALVHVNGASPFLLANLMGSALLTEEVEAGAGEIPVEHVVGSRIPGAEGFPAKGGAIRIGREVITYASFDGSAFRGCQRGAFPDAPLGLNGPPSTHARGTPVIAYDAFQIAVHLLCGKPGSLAPFENLGALRSVAAWAKGMGIPAQRLQGLEPWITVFARRETAEWLATQTVVNALPSGADQEEVIVRDDVGNPSGSTAYFNPGTIVRITDGENTAYSVIERVGDPGGGQRDKLLLLAGRIGEEDGGPSFAGGRARIEALAPTPVNINTASREVLYAVMANLHLRGADILPETLVTPAVAWTIADRIVSERKAALRVDEEGAREGGPFRHAEDFGRWLSTLEREGAVSTQQRWALYRNAINPHDANLAFGTTAWCYRTLDVYHVEARVAVHDRQGQQLATATQREVVEVGSDQVTTWTLDSQTQFEARMTMGSGGKWFASYPRGVMWQGRGTAASVQPPPRAPKALMNEVYPAFEGAYGGDGGEDKGDVRLAPARIRLPGNVVFEDHMDSTWWTDGFFTETRNAYVHPVKGLLIPPGDDIYPRPFSISFWWRSMSDAQWTAFDCGISKFTNRYAIFVREGDEGPELVFRVAGGTLEERPVECWVPLSRIGYRAGEWFHLQASCSGADPSTMELLVDGVDVCRRRGITYLTTGVGQDSTDLPVESTQGFPLRGSLLVGTEIVEYDLTAQDAFRDCVRGPAARGTTAGDWPEGTPVRLLGYSLPVTLDIMAGGSNLSRPLLKMTAVRIDNVDDRSTVTIDVDGVAVPVPISGINSQRTTFSAQAANGGDPVKPLWGQSINDALDAFGAQGYAVLGCHTIGNQAQSGGGGSNSETIGGFEIVFYRRAGSNFEIERYQATPNQQASLPYFLVTHVIDDTDDNAWPCFMVPISVQSSSGGIPGEDYLDPSLPQDKVHLERYGGDGDGRVMLGTDAPVGAVECIRYSLADRRKAAPTLLFTQERHIANLTAAFFEQTRDVNASAPTEPDPEPPPEPEPEPEPEPDPPGDPGTPDPGTPMPGGNLPPGLRDPTDPPAEDPPPPAEEPGTGGSGGSGGSGGGSQPGSGGSTGGSSGSGEPDDPADSGAPESEDTDTGGGVGSGHRPTEEAGGAPQGVKPGDEEPPTDNSGGGSSNDAEGEGPIVPDVEPLDWTGVDDEPPAPDENGSGLWHEPPFSQLRSWTRSWFRGTNGTKDLDHRSTGGGSRESLFIPCFRVWEEFSGSVNRRVGRNDIITITDGKTEGTVRYPALVRWGDPSSNWAALDQFITGPVIRAPEDGGRIRRLDGRGRARILKVPCGELPEELPRDFELARSSVTDSSVVTAFLDELFIYRHDQQPLAVLVNAEGIDAREDEIALVAQAPIVTLEGTTGHDRDVGVLDLEGELIVYRGTRVEGDNIMTLEQCVRGAYGTKARAHPNGAYGRFVPALPVSKLVGGLNRDAGSIALVHTRNWPREGLVRILEGDTAELIHYTAMSGTDLLLPTAQDADEETRDRGLFRGRFGTSALDHSDGSVVYWQPFRRWDRYTARRTEDDRSFGGFHDHAESGFLELSKRLRGAWWKSLRWVESFEGFERGDEGGSGGRRRPGESASSADDFMDVLIALRLNAGVTWGTTRVIDAREGQAASSTGNADWSQSLLVFGNMAGENRIEVESDTADLRVYFLYKPNCWLPQDLPSDAQNRDELTFQNAWKRTPKFQELTLEYVNRTTSRGGRTVLPR
jgi:hypothetical protein